jgi:hypothetical protein
MALLSFIENGFVSGEFSLLIDRLPTADEAMIIRKIAGLKKSRPKIVSTGGFQPSNMLAQSTNKEFQPNPYTEISGFWIQRLTRGFRRGDG